MTLEGKGEIPVVRADVLNLINSFNYVFSETKIDLGEVARAYQEITGVLTNILEEIDADKEKRMPPSFPPSLEGKEIQLIFQNYSQRRFDTAPYKLTTPSALVRDARFYLQSGRLFPSH